MSDDVSRANARLARLFAHGRKPDPEVAAAARRDLTAAKIERAVREAAVDAQLLTDDERNHLVSLLTAGGAR